MTALLGGMSATRFLRDYWHKRPLLVRQALPGFSGIVGRDEFLALATQKETTSRLVIQHPERQQSRWERYDGPFASLDASLLPKSHYTLLIHGVECLLPGGWELLQQFSFLPAARIDDLMVSYASDGGSVGPHDDLYDVFLLQGPGRRRWQISTQADRTPDPDAAIKVLKNFVAEQEWLLEPGDMLYLPPGVAHHGVAEGPCFTYSIGFLAPTHRELVQNFLGYLGQTIEAELDPEARYADPDLKLPRHPLAVSDAMVEQVSTLLERVRWDRAAVGEFLGRYLTGRQPESAFSPPSRPLSAAAFARRLQGRGQLELSRNSRGLVRGQQLFLNGEAQVRSAKTRRLFTQLVQDRCLPLPLPVDEEARSLLHEFYTAGYLHLTR